MRFLLLPTRFPSPESMGQGDVIVWTNWVREETEVIMNQLEEELAARGDLYDPFNGSANGVFQPLVENRSLPPPVQTPRRQENTSECSKSSRKLLRSNQKTNRIGTKMREKEVDSQVQVTPHKLSKHLLESPDPMRSIQNLHAEQRQKCFQTEIVNQNEVKPGPTNSPQELNLITFTPLQGQHEAVQGVIGKRCEPKKQRSPRRRKTRSEW